MSLLAESRKLLRYLLGKTSEIEDLDIKDIVMAKAILDIHRKKIGKVVADLPLFALHRIHELDRENAVEATARRVAALEVHRLELLRERTVSRDILARYLPSVSWIKVVHAASDVYLAFEGNGRIAALQSVFEPEDHVRVEVEQYLFRNPKKIVRRLDRVRRLNGLPSISAVPSGGRSSSRSQKRVQ